MFIDLEFELMKFTELDEHHLLINIKAGVSYTMCWNLWVHNSKDRFFTLWAFLASSCFWGINQTQSDLHLQSDFAHNAILHTFFNRCVRLFLCLWWRSILQPGVSQISFSCVDLKLQGNGIASVGWQHESTPHAPWVSKTNFFGRWVEQLISHRQRNLCIHRLN